MNRGQQLRETLEQNLKVVESFGGRVEYCLVNFIKDEEGEAIHRWLSSLTAPASFRYFATRELKAWHASVAKNTAHRVASGDFVINLDCDNFLDPTHVARILEGGAPRLQSVVFSGFTGPLKKIGRGEKVDHWYTGVLRTLKSLHPRRIYMKRIRRDGKGLHRNGTYGMIGLPKTIFLAIGGYNEKLPPMGGQDRDLFHRAFDFDSSLALLQIPQTVLPIPNDKAASLRNTEIPEADWKEINLDAKEMTRLALERGELVANADHEIGVACDAVILRTH